MQNTTTINMVENALRKGKMGDKEYAARTIGAVLGSINWIGESAPYAQVVAIDGVTEWSAVDLRPSVEQLSIFYEKDLTFVTENEDGVVTVYAIGDKPLNDYVIQATVTETEEIA